jgi:hypothetical protein
MLGRKLRWVAAAGLVALAGVAAFVLWPRPDRITEENYYRIKEGMSRAEVEAILGPPGDYRNGPTTNAEPEGRLFLLSGGFCSDAWRGDTGIIRIEFDRSGHVARVDFGSDYRVDRSPLTASLDNLLRRFRRQWRHWFP